MRHIPLGNTDAKRVSSNFVIERPEVRMADFFGSDKNLMPLVFRLFPLRRFIPEDGRFEPDLSLALDKAMIDLEEATCLQ